MWYRDIRKYGSDEAWSLTATGSGLSLRTTSKLDLKLYAKLERKLLNYKDQYRTRLMSKVARRNGSVTTCVRDGVMSLATDILKRSGLAPLSPRANTRIYKRCRNALYHEIQAQAQSCPRLRIPEREGRESR
ncbi:hypothetical protein [Escherichia phage M01]|nr:hypothetical protein [Escherichia phage M01]